jgi:hypothetical protein
MVSVSCSCKVSNLPSSPKQTAAYRIGQGPALGYSPRIGIGKQELEQLLDRLREISSNWSKSSGGCFEDRFDNG